MQIFSCKIWIRRYSQCNILFYFPTMHEPIVHCDDLFDEQTMSVHILQGQPIVRKKWKPWQWKLEVTAQIRDRSTIQDVIRDREHVIETHDTAYKEIQRKASQIWQVWPYRIVIIAPPVAPKREITIVRPLVHLRLDEYSLPDQLAQRLQTPWRWVLIAWSPWEWKTTFAQALLEQLANQNLIIKTIEAPRDVQANWFITQYGLSHTTHDEIRDILLLTRPDITLFDEVRNRQDFALYKDLRLAWVWLIGVMHATAAIDAIQRCIWVIELWMVPHVVDTVLYIKAWQVAQALTLKSTVKTPVWMQSEDLARPVIIVSSLLDGKDLYEIYTYSDNVVVMPLDETTQASKKSPIHEAAEKTLQMKVQSLIGTKCEVRVLWNHEILLVVHERDAWRVIGRWWENIQKLQEALWVSIKLKTFQELREHNQISQHSNTTTPHSFNVFTKWSKLLWEIDLGADHPFTKLLVRIWERSYPFQTNEYWVVTLTKRKLINQMETREYEIQIIN